MTALTLFASNTNDASHATGRTLVTGSGAPSTTPITTKCGTSSGFGELQSRGSGAAWPALGAIAVPDGGGFYLEQSTLNLSGNSILAGNWTMRVRANVSTGTIVANLFVPVYVYDTVLATYTQLGSTLTLNAQTLGTASANFDFVAASLPEHDFKTNEIVYYEVWANITTPSASSVATIGLIENQSTTIGATASTNLATPGFSPTPVLSTNPGSLSFSAVHSGSNPASKNTSLSETAGGGTAWTSSISYSSGSGWLAIVPTSDTLLASGSENVAFTCTTGALASATYMATVTFTATTGGATATVVVTFTVNATSTTAISNTTANRRNSRVRGSMQPR